VQAERPTITAPNVGVCSVVLPPVSLSQRLGLWLLLFDVLLRVLLGVRGWQLAFEFFQSDECIEYGATFTTTNLALSFA
jgi:hypothetical protein